jgi:hypothetical protein
MDKIFGANCTNLESWPPGNSTNFDVKPELPQGATQAGPALAGLKGQSCTCKDEYHDIEDKRPKI